MDLAQLANLGEFIGGVAVLATLPPDSDAKTRDTVERHSRSRWARPEG